MIEAALSMNLKQLLLEKDNLSISELARKTDIPQPTLHRILTGTTKNPRREVLETLADFFSISIAQLIGTMPLHRNLPQVFREHLKISTIPIIPWANICARENISATHQFKEIIVEREIGSNAFALIQSCKNMEPVFPEKSLLIFDPSREVKDRDYGLVQKHNDDFVLFNRIFIDNGSHYIKQTLEDGNIKLVKLTKHDKILAALVEVRFHFE